MKVVILGAGAVGTQIAKQLVNEKKDVVLIEKDPERARLATNRLDCMVLTRAGNNIESLREAGTATADYFIAVTDSDEVNMIACALADSEFSVPYKIARVRNVDYSTARISENGFLGIDFIVNPEIVAARAIIRTIEHGAISDIMLFEQSRVQMRHVTVEAGSVFADRSLSDIGRTVDLGFLVAIVLRDDQFIIPSGRTVLRPGDIVYVVASEDALDKLFHRLGKRRTDLRRFVIVGGGKIGQTIATYLIEGYKREPSIIRRLVGNLQEGRRRSVKIIDRDYARCKELSQLLPGALVIHGDISDEGVFEEEHFANSDLVIAVTGNQELNIVSAVYAKTRGTKRAVALVNKTNYTRIASQLGIDVPVSLKNSMVNSILKRVRRGNVKSIHSIPEGELEVLEISVDESSPAAHKPIRELTLPPSSLIVSVLREEETFIPDGSYILRAGDHIIVIAKLEHIEQIQSLFIAPQ
ncbi:MAG: Trk system potassium transporter TrkA [Spirochaetota bacterium]